ncbi:MAG: fucose isomerase, partial [Candidatus Thorarchaeota archaeon]
MTKNKVSGCYAVSKVNELDDIVAGCEGDIPSTFTMILSKFLTGTPSFMANVASVNLIDNTAIFAHCTVSISMVESYEVTSHYESGMSIGIKGKFSPQDVTVLKVGGSDLSEYWVSDGAI